jgi:exonuclease I
MPDLLQKPTRARRLVLSMVSTSFPIVRDELTRLRLENLALRARSRDFRRVLRLAERALATQHLRDALAGNAQQAHDHANVLAVVRTYLLPEGELTRATH